jgi:hypothetical protein
MHRTSNKKNSQGLYFHVEKSKGLFKECVMLEDKHKNVASWYISDLIKLLASKHPDTVWVNAFASTREGKEYIHYREALYSSMPKLELFPELLKKGTITTDHLIETKDGKAAQKKPLFKIKPSNISSLFSSEQKFDLLSFNEDR